MPEGMHKQARIISRSYYLCRAESRREPGDQALSHSRRGEGASAVGGDVRWGVGGVRNGLFQISDFKSEFHVPSFESRSYDTHTEQGKRVSVSPLAEGARVLFSDQTNVYLMTAS